MLFDNPVFAGWYTDTMSIYRNTDARRGNVDKKERRLVTECIPCRIYSVQKNGPGMKTPAATVSASDKVQCDLSVEVRKGDEIHIVRGGMLGICGEPERYFAGKPHAFYDPVAGGNTGLEHQEIPLLMDAVIE